MKCGLLGGKLGHSYSPLIHSQLGTYSYELFEKTPEQLEDFLKNGDFSGLNVTIPYKKAVIPYCAELSGRAEELGAVNTIVRRSDGTLVGHNTDYFGFETMLRTSGLDVAGKKVLVLGSGGASNTAMAVLRACGANAVVISRSSENHYGNLRLHADAAVIVNTTPVGMYPNVGQAPVDLALFPALKGVLELIYNPARTQLLLDAESRGLVTCNGLMMLVAQAKESAEWFTGSAISDDVISAIHRKLKKQTENIILVGMPGCGKTTVGRLLAELTGKTFVDADEFIVSKAGKTIPEIFAQSGEAGFRALETQVIAELGKHSALVLATGGGCVTQECNYPLLHQNSTIIWLQRDIAQLPVDGRPLSQGADLSRMYALRKPLYEHFADYTVANCGEPSDTAAQILRILEENV
ncbi:MAG: shikimate kinase [Oscillospiraceae bacterium]|nr:shikimate kinase [Oscillospiraceae bacterium]